MRPVAWSRWSDEERERQVSPSSAVGGDYRPFIARYRKESDGAVDRSPGAQLNLCVPSSESRVDLFPAQAGPTSPMVVFIHGGYWQELDRAHSRFPASSLNDAGWSYVAIGYPLAPEATIGSMVDACAEALQWIHATWSPVMLVVAGSSAGAHLAVSAAAHAGSILDGVIAFSGIYELTPLLGTSIDANLRLDVTEAERLSPLRERPAFVPTLLVVGEEETTWFHELHRMYAEHLRAHGVDVAETTVRGRNHFDVVFDLQDEDSVARRWLSDLRDRPRAPTDR